MLNDISPIISVRDVINFHTATKDKAIKPPLEAAVQIRDGTERQKYTVMVFTKSEITSLKWLNCLFI